jgi:helicase
VPAMTFYGVAEARALPLRMVGVPRAAATGLGELAPTFASFAEARDWVAALPEESWDAAGRARALSGATLRRVWLEVGGTAA